MIRKDDPKFEEAQAQAKEIFRSKDLEAIGELIAGVIDGPQMDIIDVWDTVLGQIDMTDETTRQEFETPEYCWGGRAMKYENGMTIPVTKVTKGKISVASEYIVTPAYEFDINDLASGDLGTVETIRERANRALLREKNVRGIKLFTQDVVDYDGGLRVILKGEDPAADLVVSGDKWKWQVQLKTTLDRAVKELQDMTEGGPVTMVLRTITLGDVEASGFNTASVKLVTMNAAVDPENTDRVLFDEGDILLFGRGVGSVGSVLDTQASEESNFFTVRYAFRQGHKWIRWQDRGYNSGRIRRIYLVPKIVDGEFDGNISVTRFALNGVTFYTDRAIDLSTLTDSNIIVSTTTGGGAAGGVTVGVAAVDGTMRWGTVAIAGLTAGTSYFIRFTTGVKDVAAQAFNAIEFGPYTVN